MAPHSEHLDLHLPRSLPPFSLLCSQLNWIKNSIFPLFAAPYGVLVRVRVLAPIAIEYEFSGAWSPVPAASYVRGLIKRVTAWHFRVHKQIQRGAFAGAVPSRSTRPDPGSTKMTDAAPLAV